MRNLLLFLVSITSCASAATDPVAAEWIIRTGGRVMVDGAREPVSRLADLPGREFRVTGVDLTGAVLDPKELDHLAGLEHVRELYLPGSAFTQAPAARWRVMPSSSTLRPSWTTRRMRSLTNTRRAWST
jgi:hypothetical protein